MGKDKVTVTERVKTLGHGTTSRLPSFAGHLEQTTPYIPAQSEPLIQTRGYPIFRSAAGEPNPFDSFNLMGEKRTDGNVMLVVATRDWGKTTFGMWLCSIYANRDAAGQPFRISADGHRRNAGVLELEKLVRQFGCEPVPLKSFGLNPLRGKLLNARQKLELTKDSLEHISHKRLDDASDEALRIAMSMMLGVLLEERACPTLLWELLDKLQARHVLKYRKDASQKFWAQNGEHPGIKQVFEGLTEDPGQPDVHTQRDINEVLRASRKVARLVRQWADRDCIGDENSLEDAMRQRFFYPDYTGMSEEDMVMMLSYIWRVKAAALERDDRGLLYNLEIHDENSKLWRYEIYARAMADFLKTNRGTRTLLVMMTHKLEDYETVGPSNSVAYKTAMSMQSEVSMLLVGKQKKRAWKRLHREWDVTRTEFNWLLNPPQYHWGLIISSERFRRVQVKPTPDVLELSYSNTANDSMTI